MLFKKLFLFFIFLSLLGLSVTAESQDLDEIKKRGVIRHLGVPYANFVTGDGDGLSIELVKMFAKSIGVNYQYIKTDWASALPDLIGKKFENKDGRINFIGSIPIKGDIIENGLTQIEWREKIIDFSAPVFPTQVWLVARSGSLMTPIKPGQSVLTDIEKVKEKLKNYDLLGKANTCLEPSLYNLSAYAKKVVMFDGSLNEIAPALITGITETAILDVPDVLVAIEKWQGQIKIIGPISEKQQMGAGFRKESKNLSRAFNEFLKEMKKNGEYQKLVKKYYPAVFDYFPEFFN